jgi:hypothetical protein
LLSLTHKTGFIAGTSSPVQATLLRSTFEHLIFMLHFSTLFHPEGGFETPHSQSRLVGMRNFLICGGEDASQSVRIEVECTRILLHQNRQALIHPQSKRSS